MPFIPLYVQNELQASRDAELISAFNFCDPFDSVLPTNDATISSLDMQHLWGLSTAIPAGEAIIEIVDDAVKFGKKFYAQQYAKQRRLLSLQMRQEDEEILVLIKIIGKFLL